MTYDAGTTGDGVRNRHHSCVCRWNCPDEVSLQLSGVHHRTHHRYRLRDLHPGRAAMKKLRVAAQAVAICGVIAVLAWSKSHAVTVALPYFPHRRSLAVRAK